jgi:hypothetical protein
MAFIALAFIHFGEPQPAPAELLRLQVTLPAGAQPDLHFAVSPDGRHITFIGSGSDGIQRVWLRSLDAFEARPLAGTDMPESGSIFWSPDSRFLVFAAGGRLKKIDISGGPAQTVCEVVGAGVIGGAWNREGIIIFGSNPGGRPGGGGMFRVSAAGGTASPLTKPDATRNEFGHRFPMFLPDGRHFLYLRTSTTPENSGIYVGSIDATPEQQSSTPLLAAAFGPAQYIASTKPGATSGKGRLLFLRENTLIAQFFDDRTLELSGEPVPVAEPVGSFLDRGLFSASDNGTLVYTTASSVLDYQLTWFERQGGKVLGTVGEPGGYSSVTLSPDGTKAAVVRNEYRNSVNRDIWVFDLARGSKRDSLSTPPGIRVPCGPPTEAGSSSFPTGRAVRTSIKSRRTTRAMKRCCSDPVRP